MHSVSSFPGLLLPYLAMLHAAQFVFARGLYQQVERCLPRMKCYVTPYNMQQQQHNHLSVQLHP